MTKYMLLYYVFGKLNLIGSYFSTLQVSWDGEIDAQKEFFNV